MTTSLPKVIAFRHLALFGVAVLCLLTACDDDQLSNIGQSIQPKRDVVEAQQYKLQFEAKTLRASEQYIGTSPEVLLGAYEDPSYGSFVADFATQFRSGAGLRFAHKPEGGQIDSVSLQLIYAEHDGYVGSLRSPMQISIYELPESFSGRDHSSEDLADYADEAKRLGQEVVTLSTHAKDLSIIDPQSTPGQYAFIELKLDRELGQRIYEATAGSLTFDEPTHFPAELFAGLYVQPSVGKGFVLKISALRLLIHYHYTNSEGKKQDTAQAFINTKISATRKGLYNEALEPLLQDNPGYSYSKSPAGVQTAITLGREAMQKLLPKGEHVDLGKNFVVANAQLNIGVDNPEDVLLSPPSYMMLIPEDRLGDYFVKGYTELSTEVKSYLSTAYSLERKAYNFFNIGAIITAHLAKYASFDAQTGVWTVSKDLELRLVPVERSVARGRGSEQTTVAIEPYLFPSFVRLKTDGQALLISLTVSRFN